jgi:diketogulonate reductase-like aldo/keto reductase
MTPTLPLSNGVHIPAVGLGVFQVPPGQARTAVHSALQLGYRHIDTAAVYGNEAEVGAAVRESGLPRDDVFVTTKLWNNHHGEERALLAFEDSRRRLGLEQIDLFLLHWPVAGKRQASWRALERLLADGRVRAIGVSNFLPRHLDELAAGARVLPHVNQLEVHPFHAQPETRAWCAAHGVVVAAYSPLTKGRRLAHPVVRAAAERLGRSPAQVLLRWGVEAGMVVLPKSVRPERMAENLAIFDFALDAESKRALGAADEGLATGWDPRQQE